MSKILIGIIFAIMFNSLSFSGELKFVDNELTGDIFEGETISLRELNSIKEELINEQNHLKEKYFLSLDSSEVNKQIIDDRKHVVGVLKELYSKLEDESKTSKSLSTITELNNVKEQYLDVKRKYDEDKQQYIKSVATKFPYRESAEDRENLKEIRQRLDEQKNLIEKEKESVANGGKTNVEILATVSKESAKKRFKLVSGKTSLARDILGGISERLKKLENEDMEKENILIANLKERNLFDLQTKKISALNKELKLARRELNIISDSNNKDVLEAKKKYSSMFVGKKKNSGTVAELKSKEDELREKSRSLREQYDKIKENLLIYAQNNNNGILLDGHKKTLLDLARKWIESEEQRRLVTRSLFETKLLNDSVVNISQCGEQLTDIMKVSSPNLCEGNPVDVEIKNLLTLNFFKKAPSFCRNDEILKRISDDVNSPSEAFATKNFDGGFDELIFAESVDIFPNRDDLLSKTERTKLFREIKDTLLAQQWQFLGKKQKRDARQCGDTNLEESFGITKRVKKETGVLDLFTFKSKEIEKYNDICDLNPEEIYEFMPFLSDELLSTFFNSRMLNRINVSNGMAKLCHALAGVDPDVFDERGKEAIDGEPLNDLVFKGVNLNDAMLGKFHRRLTKAIELNKSDNSRDQIIDFVGKVDTVKDLLKWASSDGDNLDIPSIYTNNPIIKNIWSSYLKLNNDDLKRDYKKLIATIADKKLKSFSLLVPKVFSSVDNFEGRRGKMVQDLMKRKSPELRELGKSLSLYNSRDKRRVPADIFKDQSVNNLFHILKGNAGFYSQVDDSVVLASKEVHLEKDKIFKKYFDNTNVLFASDNEIPTDIDSDVKVTNPIFLDKFFASGNKDFFIETNFPVGQEWKNETEVKSQNEQGVYYKLIKDFKNHKVIVEKYKRKLFGKDTLLNSRNYHKLTDKFSPVFSDFLVELNGDDEKRKEYIDLVKSDKQKKLIENINLRSLQNAYNRYVSDKNNILSPDQEKTIAQKLSAVQLNLRKVSLTDKTSRDYIDETMKNLKFRASADELSHNTESSLDSALRSLSDSSGLTFNKLGDELERQNDILKKSLEKMFSDKKLRVSTPKDLSLKIGRDRLVRKVIDNYRIARKVKFNGKTLDASLAPYNKIRNSVYNIVGQADDRSFPVDSHSSKRRFGLMSDDEKVIDNLISFFDRTVSLDNKVIREKMGDFADKFKEFLSFKEEKKDVSVPKSYEQLIERLSNDYDKTGDKKILERIEDSKYRLSDANKVHKNIRKLEISYKNAQKDFVKAIQHEVKSDIEEELNQIFAKVPNASKEISRKYLTFLADETIDILLTDKDMAKLYFDGIKKSVDKK